MTRLIFFLISLTLLYSCKTAQFEPNASTDVENFDQKLTLKQLMQDALGGPCEIASNTSGSMVLARRDVEAGGFVFAVYHNDSSKIVFRHTEHHVIGVRWADSARLKIRPARGIATLYPDQSDYLLDPISGKITALSENLNIEK